jgi:hypothetical protein
MNREDIPIPDFLDGAPVERIEKYKNWIILGDKIDTHPERYMTLEGNPEYGEEVVTLDFKQSPAVVYKFMRKAVISEEIKEEIDKRISFFRSQIAIKAGIRKGWDSLKDYKKRGPKKGRPTSFLDLKSAEILELFGQWKTSDDVERILKEHYGYSVSRTELNRFYNLHKDRIKVLREVYEKSYDELSITKKTSRLQQMAYLAHELMEKFALNKSVVVSKEIRGIFEQVKNEVEGEVIRLDISGQIDVNATLTLNRSLRELVQRVPINSIIISMVAAKRGLDPVALMGQFTNSFYRNHNGFSPFLVQSGQEQAPLPSNLIYDWNEINKMHERDEEGVEDAVIVVDSPSLEVESKKARLMKMLEDSKQLIELQHHDKV